MGFSPLAYPGTRQTFFVSALAVAPASGKSMISLETTTANIVLRLHAIQLYNVQSSAVVGVNAQFDLTRFTSHAAGTALTITSNDSTNSLSVGATARTGATLTGEVTTPLRSWFVNLDDIGAGAAQNQGLGSLFGQNWQFLSDFTVQPPTIRQNQGLSIRCATATVVGTVNVALHPGYELMATRAYDSTAEGLAFDTAIDCFEVRNPAGSGKLLWVIGFDFVAEVGFTEWLFKRYTGAATTGGTATAVAAHKADTNDANSVMLIYSATAAGDIDVSGLGAPTYEKHVVLDPSDAGDDSEWIPGKYYASDFKLIVRPGETFVVTSPAVVAADYDIGVRFIEVDP